jgi:hypothetical protein
MAADISISVLRGRVSFYFLPGHGYLRECNTKREGTLTDHATCAVQPGGLDQSVVDSLPHGSLDVVAASAFLGIFGLRRGRVTLRCLHM